MLSLFFCFFYSSRDHNFSVRLKTEYLGHKVIGKVFTEVTDQRGTLFYTHSCNWTCFCNQMSHPVLPIKQTMGFIHICIVLESYVDLEYKSFCPTLSNFVVLALHVCCYWGWETIIFVKLLVLHLQTSATNFKHRFHWFLLPKVKSSKQKNISKSVFYSSVMLMSLLKFG